MNRLLLLSLAILSLLLAACGSDTKAVPELTDEALANATYPLELAPGGSAKFTNGEFSSGQTRATLLDPRGHGSLNPDEAEDAAVVITASGGGSGTFYYLIALLNLDGEPSPIAWALLGDRVPVNSVAVTDGMIVVKLREHGPGEPLCCPTVEATRTYALRGQTLELVSKTTP
jgi:hypothetical protein